MQCPPDAGPKWLLAEVLAVLHGSVESSPPGVDLDVFRRWRIGRVLETYRRSRWLRHQTGIEAPDASEPRFPYGDAAITELAGALRAAGIDGFSRPTLFRCLTLGRGLPRAALLPPQVPWATIKAWGTKGLITRAAAARKAAPRAQGHSQIKERVIAALSQLQPDCRAYRSTASVGTPYPDAIVVLRGHAAFAVRVLVGAAQPVPDQNRISGLAVLTITLDRVGRLKDLAWTPRLDPPVPIKAMRPWVVSMLKDGQRDPYDQGADSP